jgi:prepilin-type N-terminal cleavage/methylation domain-containing protein
MSVVSWWRRRFVNREAGFTLVEMMVAIFVLAFLMAGVTETMIMTQKTMGKAGSQLNDADQARTGIDALVKNLRTAVLPTQFQDAAGAAAAFILGSNDTSVQFYADLNVTSAQGPSRVTYAVCQSGTTNCAGPSDGTASLVETLQPPDQPIPANLNYTWCTPGPGCTSQQRRIIARGLAWPATKIFTYYDSSGNAIPPPLSTIAVAANVRTVDVTITIKSVSGFNKVPTTYVERVGLPNVDVVPTASPSP